MCQTPLPNPWDICHKMSALSDASWNENPRCPKQPLWFYTHLPELHPSLMCGHSARCFKTQMLMTIDGVSLFFGGARWAVCVYELLLSVSFSPVHRMCPSPFLQLSWTCLWLQNFFGLVKLPSPFLLLLCLPHFFIFGLLLAFDLPFSFSQISSFSSLCLAISQPGELGNSSAPGEMFYLL